MTKPLSDKQFVRAASGRVSAIGFLEQYEEHIRTNYPAAIAGMDKFKSGEMLATPALEFVKNVVRQHIHTGMVRKAEESIRKAHEPAKEKKASSKSGVSGNGKYSIQIFHKCTNERTGEFSIELFEDHNGIHTFQANSYQDAERISDRKLFNLATSSYATITSNLNNGKSLTTKVKRDDAIGRFLNVRAGAVCKVKPTSAPLKQTMSVHNYVATFSRG